MNQLYFSKFPFGLGPEAELNRLETLRVKRVGRLCQPSALSSLCPWSFPPLRSPAPWTQCNLCCPTLDIHPSALIQVTFTAECCCCSGGGRAVCGDPQGFLYCISICRTMQFSLIPLIFIRNIDCYFCLETRGYWNLPESIYCVYISYDEYLHTGSIQVVSCSWTSVFSTVRGSWCPEK